CVVCCIFVFFFSSRRRHTRSDRDWSSDVCSSDLAPPDALSMLVGIVLLMALYEVSIGCAWVVTKRRARREQASRGSAAGVVALRSEERRVGKECRSGWSR